MLEVRTIISLKFHSRKLKQREVKRLERYRPDHVEMQNHAREFKLHLVQNGKTVNEESETRE